MNSERFPKSGWHVRRCRFSWRPLYVRIANACELWWLGLHVIAPAPWRRETIYGMGWDAGWRAARP